MPLYIISTPIGNLEDITVRAVKTLEQVDLILAEDTRRTAILFGKYNIRTRMQSYNDHNKERITPLIIKLLKEGKSIGLVSDAGTPAISDPGFYVTREAIRNGITIIPIPGPSAVLAALVSTGFATDAFIFLGFLPKSNKQRIDILKDIGVKKDMTFIVYESPYRIEKTIEMMSEIMPDRRICIGREMTKKFEEFIRGNAKEVFEKIKDRNIKGEMTIVIDKVY